MTKERLIREREALRQKLSDLEKSDQADLHAHDRPGVSVREQTEEALSISRLQLAEAMDLAHIVYWEVDPATQNFIFNDPFYAFYGTTAEREGGYMMSREEYAVRFIHPDDLPLYHEFVQNNTARPDQEYVSDIEHRIIRRTGEVRHIRVRTRIQRDSDGRILRRYGDNQDITETKLAEEERRLLEHKLLQAQKEAMDLAHIAYWEVDPVTGDFVLNDLYYAFYGTTAEIEGGYRFSHEEFAVRFIHPEDVQSFHELVRKNLARQSSNEPLLDYEHRIIRRTGEVGYIRVRTRIHRDSGGRILRIYGANQDITETKLAEEERLQLENKLLQAQKMESIGTLAGGIAHDFNNLLMNMQGNVSLMLLDFIAGHPHYDLLKNIEAQVQSGADLTRQLLGFARAGRYEVMPLKLSELIAKSAEMFGRTRKEIIIHQKHAQDLWLVEADRGQIEQVLLNLFVNAWQAMMGGGSIYLETQNVFLDEHYARTVSVEPGRYVKISVTDTGVGMDETTKARIFEPFFTTKGMGRGTGLGLAMVYGIVRGHSGVINVYSEKGHGTTFNIYLPASEQAAIISDTPIPTEIVQGGETILLIDDEEMILTISKKLLEKLGYRIITAKNGREAIEIYRSQRGDIDLVLLDMIMPGLSGGETFDQLKAINPAIKVILASGYSINGQAADIMERGCRTFIQKPFTLRVLSQKVRTVLDT